MNERILVAVVYLLGLLSVLLVLGIIALAALGREVPTVLAGACGMTIGALVGIITPTRPGW